MAIYNWYIRLEFLLCALMVLGTVFAKLSFASFCFSVTFIVLFATWFYGMCHTKKVQLLLLLFIVLISAHVAMNASFTSISLVSFTKYIQKVIIAVSTILSFYVVTVFVPYKRTRTLIAWLPVGIGSFLIVSYYFLGNTSTYAQGLTLNFTNPNFTAMWLLHLLLYGVYNFFSVRPTHLRLFCLGYCILITQLLFLTLSRACIGALAAFILLLMWGFLKQSYRLPPQVLLGLLLFPLIFLFIYMNFTHYLMYTTTFDMVVLEGKSITSRVDVWHYALECFKNSWLIGDYAAISHGAGMSQMGNIYLDILASYGIVPLVIFIRLLWKILTYANDNLTNFPSYVAFISFLTILLSGTFEAGLVAGCMGLNFLTSGFLVLIHKETI